MKPRPDRMRDLCLRGIGFALCLALLEWVR